MLSLMFDSYSVMRKMCRKRNQDIILTSLLIVILMVVWLNLYLTRTLNQNRRIVDCNWPCIGVTCKQCTSGTNRDVPNVDLLSHLKLKQIQRGSSSHNVKSLISTQQNDLVCRRASFDLDHDSVKYAFFHLNTLNCTGTQLFYVDSPMYRLNTTVLDERKVEKCLYFGINRLNDDFHIYTEPFVKQEPPFDLVFKQDFVHVKCYLKEKPKTKNIDSIEQFTKKNNSTQDKGLSNISNKTTILRQTGANVQNVTVGSQSAGKDTIHKKSQSNQQKHKLSVTQQKHNMSVTQQRHNLSVTRHLMAEMEMVDPTNTHTDQGYADNLNDYMYDPFEDYLQQEEMADFEQLLVQVYPKSDVFERISRRLSKRKSQAYMDVLILGLDSMSHLSFQRKLPLTYKYLKQRMKATILDGYNIVGDATTAALIPILTGKFETELPEVRRNQFESQNVDVYPLIWKQFEKAGYVTMFAEDEPTIGAFNLRLNGFDDPPTDHYMRPFWQALWDTDLRRSSPRYCTSYKPNHEYLLDYLKDFYIKYNNVSKFAFVFGSELTHWDNNPGEYMDKDLRDLLQYLEDGNYLNNTLLIVMGDHGARYSRVRKTVQGKMEERLPMMSLRFPKWFRKQFPDLVKNLDTNSDKLTTPFDIHETLRDVLDLKRTQSPVNQSSRAFSLLSTIPVNRTCASSQIQMHWCTCLKQLDIDPSDGVVSKSAQAMLNFINDQTLGLRDRCSRLKLKQIVHAQLLIPNEKVLMFQKSKDDDQREANFSQSISVDHAHFQVTMETLPNNGLYEATIQVNMTAGSYTVLDDVSRLNLYGNQPLCIQKSHPDLRKYCFCVS